MITADTLAEIRRLHRLEKVPFKQIASDLGIGRRTLLAEHTTMPATVITERIGRAFLSSLLRGRVYELRPYYRGVDPADRACFATGEVIQCNLWLSLASRTEVR